MTTGTCHRTSAINLSAAIVQLRREVADGEVKLRRRRERLAALEAELDRALAALGATTIPEAL